MYLDTYYDLAIRQLEEFHTWYFNKTFVKCDKKYKPFQKELVNINDSLSKDGLSKDHIIKSFLEFSKLDEPQAKTLIQNAFTGYIKDLVYSGISKKDYSLFKIKGFQFSPIKFVPPTLSQFLVYTIKYNCKHLYKNVKIIKEQQYVLQNFLSENIKNCFYKFLPTQDILNLQQKVKHVNLAIQNAQKEEQKEEQTEQSSSSSSSHSPNSARSSSHSKTSPLSSHQSNYDSHSEPEPNIEYIDIDDLQSEKDSSKIKSIQMNF